MSDEPDLSDLDEEAGGAHEGGDPELEEIVEQVVHNANAFTVDQVEDMLLLLHQRGVEWEEEYDADFDIYAFLNKNVQQLNVMRAKLMSQDGRVRLSANQRDLKDLMAASRAMADMMLKHQKQILDFRRVQKIESATRQAMEDVDPGLVDKFVNRLEELLKDGEE